MKTLTAAVILLAAMLSVPAGAAPNPTPACQADLKSALLLPQPTEASTTNSWCHIWCPSPPYSMEWYIGCEATYCGTTFMYCGSYSLSCEQCQDAYDNGGPQCVY